MKLLATGICLSVFGFSQAGEIVKQISKKEYVEQWRSTAVQQMIQYKIPASITLAQGILESGSGNSDLAIKGKNHFGIKCADGKVGKVRLDEDQ